MISFAKKFLSIALAAVLLLSVFPMAASATDYTVRVYVQDPNGSPIGNYTGTKVTDITVTDSQKVLEEVNKVTVTYPDGYDPAGSVVYADSTAVENAAPTVDNRNVVILTKPHVHSFVKDAAASKDATCTADGVLVQKCACGEVDTQIVSATGHNYVKDESASKPATCTAPGALVEVCSKCGDIKTTVLPAGTHKYVKDDKASVAPTCTAKGKLVEVCSECKDVKTTEIPATGHKYEIVTETAPTCTKEGAQYKKCSVCGDITDIKTLAKVDHDWAPYVTVKEATAIKEGVEERTCKVCGKTESRAIPKTGAAILSWNITFDENLPSEYKNSTRNTYEIKDGQRIGSIFSKGMPIPSCNRYIFKGWYLTNADESLTNVRVTGETLYDFGRHVTLKAVWEEEARVKLMIYRNGNTSSAYDEVQLYGYGVGDVINTNNLNIKDYYKNGDKPFKWEGWFDREGWTYFKAKENAKPISSIRTVGLDGTTVLFAMVYDDNAPASNKTPDHTNPKTGDESMILATTAVMLVSAGALAVFFMDRKRRNG